VLSRLSGRQLSSVKAGLHRREDANFRISFLRARHAAVQRSVCILDECNFLERVDWLVERGSALPVAPSGHAADYRVRYSGVGGKNRVTGSVTRALRSKAEVAELARVRESFDDPGVMQLR